MVAQQSAAAKIGRHSSDVRAAINFATASRVAFGSRMSSMNSAGKPIALREGSPEFLLERAAGDELAVLRRIKLVARRAADEPHFARRRKAPGRRAERQRRPGEGEHRVGHGDVDMAALPALVALAQRQQNIDHRRKAAAGDVGGQHRRHHRTVGRPGLQIQQAGIADVVEVVPGLVARAARSGRSRRSSNRSAAD